MMVKILTISWLKKNRGNCGTTKLVLYRKLTLEQKYFGVIMSKTFFVSMFITLNIVK
jgi:hypothetical protein